MIALCCSLGCDRTDAIVQSSRGSDESNTRLVSAEMPPKVLLEEVKRRYRELASYEDQAVVRLRYELNGETVVDEAPLSVAWDQQGRLGLRVYSVAAGPSGERWRMRLGERRETSTVDGAGGTLFSDSAAEPTFDHQVLSRSLPEKVDFDWLLFDPLIGQYLAAGMAGFPPQLDLLLSPSPLGGLVDDSVTLSYAAPQKIDRQLCHLINVQRPNMTYRLWIDQATGLLRRIEVPRANVPPHIAEDRRISRLELSIDIEGVLTNHNVDWQRFELKVYPEDILVKQFVLPPATFDTWGMGEQFPAFTLRDEAGEDVYRGGERSARSITVLTWLADHPTCRVTAEQLARIEEQFTTPEWQDRVNFVSIWAAPQPPTGLSFQELREYWNLPGIFALDGEALGRDLFEIHEAPTMVVLDSQNRLQARLIRVQPHLEDFLPGLLQELSSGANVAEQTLERERLFQQRYRAELAMAVASDGEPRALPASYPSTNFPVERGAELPLPAGPPRAVGTMDHKLWLLARDGELTVQALGARPTARWATGWRDVNGQTSLSVAPDESCVALLSDNRQRLRVFTIRGEQATELQLAADATVIDLQWLRFSDDALRRLVVIDDQARTIVFDPLNHEQLTGQCPREPLAIVGTGGADATAGELGLGSSAIVLVDGTLEQLAFAEDSLLHSVSNVRPHQNQDRPVISSGRQLGFKPAAGPWIEWPGSGGAEQLILARGWLRPGEPAWFMLDRQLRPVWHALAPRTPPSGQRLSSVATDPTTGQAVWAVMEVDRTVHLLRADGLVDHFRVSDPVVGLSLVPRGTTLNLVLVHRDRLQTYEIKSRF